MKTGLSLGITAGRGRAVPGISTPTLTITGGTSDVSLTPELNTSAFANTGGASDSHVSTDWQISDQADFSNIVWQSLADTTDKVQITVDSDLDDAASLYVRARHNGATYASSWSSAVAFTTIDVVVDQPSVTSPSDDATDIGETPTITTGAFAVTNGSDTHASTDWQIASDSDFSTIVVQSLADASNKVSWDVPSGNLSTSTEYFIRVRHNGTTYGASGWSSTVSFTTAAAFVSFMEATGGTVSEDGDYKVHTFNSSGTFTVTQLADGDPDITYLIVGGGGGGASAIISGPVYDGAQSGGGGGGAVKEGSIESLSLTGHSVSVGAGGTYSQSAGQSSSFNGITAGGGGRGGNGVLSYGSDNGTNGLSGTSGSGGGGGGYSGNTSHTGGSGSSPGGDGGDNNTGTYTAGAGGGAGGNGGQGTSEGAGVTATMDSVTYGAGGEGGQSGADGPANTGNGGDGAANSTSGTTERGGTGGSGRVKIRYKFQ